MSVMISYNKHNDTITTYEHFMEKLNNKWYIFVFIAGITQFACCIFIHHTIGYYKLARIDFQFVIGYFKSYGLMYIMRDVN